VISIIIPTLNEADHIGAAVAHARALGECEMVVVDGGSTDGTIESAADADCVLSAERGRAAQMNAGARVSRGDVLLFLHADCRLDPGALEAIQAAVTDARTVGGCFQQRIESPGWRYRLVERGNALRVHALKWIYGDQALFVRRAIFEELGGFPPVPLMEDLLFAKRLRRRGRVRLLDLRVHVSPRRWQRAGVVRQTLRNWGLIAALHLGVSPHRLARFYPHVRGG
jgi:rSAM/selenodomain-associated transferase 2